MAELCVLWGLEGQKQSQGKKQQQLQSLVIQDCARIFTNNPDLLGT